MTGHTSGVSGSGRSKSARPHPPTISKRPTKLHYLRASGHTLVFRFGTTPELITLATTGGPVPPPDWAGTVYCSSSPVMVKGRFCSSPSQLGNVEVSILKVMILSSTDKVPKWVMLPWTIALFSAGVPVVRLLDATLGRLSRATASAPT